MRRTCNSIFKEWQNKLQRQDILYEQTSRKDIGTTSLNSASQTYGKMDTKDRTYGKNGLDRLKYDQMTRTGGTIATIDT